MPEHKNLWSALSAVTHALPTMPKDAVNPHFKSHFTPLDTIVEKATPILFEHGLAWSTKPGISIDGEPTLAYALGHGASGESLTGEMLLLPVKKDPQAQGSAITYARRYAMCAVLNIVADEDMDGETDLPKASKAKPKPAAPKVPGTISAAAVKELADAYKKSEWKTPDAADPDETLRMQLGAVGAGNEGPIAACIKALTEPQALTVLSALTDIKP